MHLDQSALGILRKAEDKNGRKYMDWRIPYMDQLGLIMVYKSDSRYEKYMIYFFTSPANKCPGKYLHTTYGSIQVEDGSLTIRTKNSVYEFELDASCVSEVDMILLLRTVNEYFRDDGSGNHFPTDGRTLYANRVDASMGADTHLCGAAALLQ